MRPGRSATLALICVCALSVPEAFAQRGRGGGGRGGAGGGMQRGGMPQGGMQRGGMPQGGMQRGGMPGGMPQGGMQRGGMPGGMPQGGMQRGGMPGGGMPQGGLSGGPRGPQMGGGSSMGPYGRGGGMPSAAARPGTAGAGAGAAARPGVGAGGMPPTAATRPGAGAGAGAAARPGVGAGGVGGPASGVGVRPGLGAGRPGVGVGGVGGPASGVGVLPGAGAGLPGTPATRDYARDNGYGYGYGRPYGTYYASGAALAAQRNALLASSVAYSMYNPAMYAGAWQSANMMNSSMYANPGYGNVSGMMGLPAQPVPYDYGGNVVAQGDSVYVNGDPVGTTQEYANQAGQIAAAGASDPDPKAAWQPLGVYAMVEPDQNDPNDLFQLAVNAQGQIRGNYHNIQSNETIPVAGSVDRKTGRAAWTIGGDKLPIYEAGIANLTSDHCTMLVHAPDNQQRQFTLIHLPDPQGQGQGQGAPAGQ